MGINDRDYIKTDRNAGASGVFRGHSAVAVLLGLNLLIFFLWQMFNGDDQLLRDHFEVSRQGVVGHHRIHTLFTYALSHQDPVHLFFNMLFLWWFGKELEESIYGPRTYLFLYFFGAAVAGLAHIVAVPFAPALGASGAVMAVVVVCAFLFPDRPVYLLWGAVPVPLKWLVIAYVVFDLTPVLRREQTGIANAAHLGGAAAGAAFYLLDLRVFRRSGELRSPVFAGLRGMLVRLRGRLRPHPPRILRLKPLDDTLPPLPPAPPRPEPPEPVPEPASGPDVATASRVDDLLRKIAGGGMQSLSAEEREFLKSASGKYKK